MSNKEGVFDYIFGFGSIMNSSTHATWQIPDKKSSCMGGAVATIKKSFGYKRKWNFRSTTGFTALGVVLASEDNDTSDDINGVLFQVPHYEMSNFDRREVGYKRVAVPLKYLEFHPDMSGTTKQTQFCIGLNDNIWLYVPLPSQTMYADENHPLLQSYVDTVLQGCLEWGGERMAEEFILTTGGWSCFYLNDTPSSRRPWLFRKQYTTIDQLLSKHSELTNYGDRRHPEEFAQAFNQRMKGTWSIPRRNHNFTGREKELDDIQSRFSSQEMGRQRIVVKVEVCGMGGVGKTQLVTEYCYRHFPSKYGLVVWLNAETVDTLITDYRQLLADLANNNLDSDMEKSSTEEIIREVRTRLFRSNVPWLLIYDNLEDHSILERFVPRGAGMKGHILVTTRQVDSGSGIDSNAVLSLGCLDTSEAIELLIRSAGKHNMEGASNVNAAKELVEKLGSLPLALSIAAAYMRQCDVQCSEYVARYNASEKDGQSLIQHGNSVASSLSLILPKIQEKNQTTSEVLHLLSFLGSDGVTKMLLRYLLNAKKNIDQKIAEGKVKARAKKQALLVSSLSFCLLVGGAALMLSGTSRHRASALAMIPATATSIFVLSRIFAGEPKVNSFPKKRESSRLSLTFSAFEYEESDISWDILKSFSLLSVKEGRATIHRLLQQAMRSCQSQEDSIYYMTICIDAMLSYWSFKPDAIETWKPSLLLLEHVKSVVGYAQEYEFSERETLRLSTLSKEAGVLSAIYLNAFVEAQSSLELSIKLLEKRPTMAKAKEFRRARASTLHELSKIHRYQGRYNDAGDCLMDSLGLLNKSDDSLTADIYHELGILEVKQHNLESATSFLERSLDIRRGLDDTDSDQINASSTLHQLAAINVARKPPSLDKAKRLLEEALSLSRQIGQRAATIKQLARVTIRQGHLDEAEALLEQALQLYLELYDNNKLHINVAAVKFQQGALALQRERSIDAKRHFNECLLIRRHVYAYACPVQGSECHSHVNPTHLEVACVLHEIGRVDFSSTRFSQSMEMFKDEKIILERLMEASTNDGVRIYQARLNNLTWLRKCAKEMGNDDMATLFANERNDLKQQTGEQSKQTQQKLLHCESVSLQSKVVQSRLLARRFALEKKNSSNQSCKGELSTIINELSDSLKIASSGPMKRAAMEFRDTLLPWIDKPNNRAPILTACDHLRDVLRAHGVEVNDSSHPCKI